MKLLATLKPERYELPHHSYGVLAEIDWPARRVVRTLKFPSASFRDERGFMAPLVGGVCAVGRRLFMALWNGVVEIDYDTFQVVNAVSSPWMADLHGMDSDGHLLYVAATGVTALLALDLADLSTVWQWGPDEPLLRHGESLRQRWCRLMARPQREFRHTHKSRSPHYRHHLNDVCHHQGYLYLTTLKWFDSPGGAVIRLHGPSRQAEFFIPPGGVFGPHDGLFAEGRYLVTESAANGVAWRLAQGEIQRARLGERAFVRGLCRLGDGFLVGFTRLRHHPAPSWIIEFDGCFQKELGRMDVSGFYPPDVGTAIHALLPSPNLS